jgi:hypothetical protein
MLLPFNKKSKSVKELIVAILSTQWPLTIKQIKTYLKQNFNCDVSYQAVYKSILELQSEGILTKKENGWQLSFDWITNTYHFFHKLKDLYGRNPFLNSFVKENIITITLKNLLELDKFYFELFDNLIANSKGKIVIFCLRHNWRPILYAQKEFELIKKSTKQYYFLCGGNTPLDKWCAEFEKKLGTNVKNGVNYSTACDLYIIDDSIIQIYFPKELLEKIDALFNYSKNIEDVNINDIICNIFEKYHKITIVINRNDELARQMRHQILDFFEEKHSS